MNAFRISAICLVTSLILSCSRSPHDSVKDDSSRSISASIRDSINPFTSTQMINFVRINLEKSNDQIAYSINGRPLTSDALDVTLGKFAEIDLNQVITIDADFDLTLNDIVPIATMLKQHGFKNVARRGDNDTVIWMPESDL